MYYFCRYEAALWIIRALYCYICDIEHCISIGIYFNIPTITIPPWKPFNPSDPPGGNPEYPEIDPKVPNVNCCATHEDTTEGFLPGT